MRDIKFRGLGVDGKWWYGESNPKGENHVNLATFFMNAYAGAFRLETIVEYTGLKDSKGIEIYEGDLLTYPKHKGHYLIKWDEGECGFTCEREKPFNYMLPVVWKKMKVVGNIYERRKNG